MDPLYVHCSIIKRCINVTTKRVHDLVVIVRAVVAKKIRFLVIAKAALANSMLLGNFFNAQE